MAWLLLAGVTGYALGKNRQRGLGHENYYFNVLNDTTDASPLRVQHLASNGTVRSVDYLERNKWYTFESDTPMHAIQLESAKGPLTFVLEGYTKDSDESTRESVIISGSSGIYRIHRVNRRS